MAIATMRVPTIFTAVDRFSDVVTRMTRTTANFGATAQAAAMRTSRAFNTAGTQMLTAGVGMAVGIGYAVNEVGKFEKSISNISTLTENTPAEMKAIGDSILNISKKVPVAIEDLTSGMYDVVSAGITGTANQLGVLDSSARLAVAGLGTTKEAVNITTSALNAFNEDAGNSVKVTNMLMKAVKYGKTTVSGISESFGSFASIMKNSNVSLEEYLASAAALTTTGMSMSRAQTQVSSATIALIKPNETMAAIYQKLGVKDVPAFIKQSGGLVGALQKVNDVAKSMGLNLGKVMGRKEGLSALLSLLGAQKEKFKEIMNDMASGTDVVNEAFAKQQETLSAKIQIMKNQMTILAIRIGEVLIPRIKNLLDTVIPNVEAFTAWSERNKGFANTLMTVAKWMLILGVTAKILAFAFRTYAFYLGIAKTVTKAYTFISTLAALANVSFTTALWGAITAMWSFVVAEAAILAPILLIVGGLGLLTYSMLDTKSATENMVGSQISSLEKGNMAWKNSTNVMSTELKKQQDILNKPMSKFSSPSLPINKFYDEQSKLNPSSPNFDVKKYNELGRKGVELSRQNFKSNILPSFEKKPISLITKESVEKPKNLSGGNDYNVDRLLKHLEKERNIKLNIEADEGLKVKIVGDVPEGLEVKTTPNQGSRDQFWWGK